MNFSFLRKLANATFLGACLALGASSCLAPPSETAANTTGRVSIATPADHDPLPFTHTSPELLAGMHLGWNLGNGLDVPDGETAWGNPPATPELMSAVAKAGFDLVRIPVTWARHTEPGPDYTIDPSFFERVSEVVGYAHSAGLYAVINVHHDGADGFAGVEWLTLNDSQGDTTEENNAAVRAHFVAVWTQIADYFKNYGEELLFESMNEIHDGYGKPDPRHFSFINELNQEFVNLVRKSGGNNARRHLVVPGYNTNIEHTLSGFKLPSDSAEHRLILSVHFYDPYLFTLQGKTHTWGNASPGKDDWGQENYVVEQFDKLKTTFVDQGVPVLLGEYGATYQADFADYQRYYVEYVTKAATDRGILPVYWDNGGRGSGSDNFGLIDRQSGEVLHPELLKAMLRAATTSYALGDIALPAP